MKKEEFEAFVALVKSIKEKAPTLLADYFQNKELNFGSKKTNANDYITLMLSYAKYENVPKQLVEYDEVFSNNFYKTYKQLEELNKQFEKAETATANSKNVPVEYNINDPFDYKKKTESITVDRNFFRRMATNFVTARESTSFHSKEFDEMQKKLIAVYEFYKQFATLSVNKDGYLVALDELAASADAYLATKLNKTVSEKSIIKVNTAIAIKEYIAERKADIFRENMLNGIEAMRKDYLEAANNEYQKLYANKIAELTNTGIVLGNMLGASQDVSVEAANEISTIISDAKNLVSECHEKENFSEIMRENSLRGPKGVASMVALDIVRNELLAGGGKVTPLLEKFFKNPAQFVSELQQSKVVTHLLAVGRFHNHVNTDCQANVVRYCMNGLANAITDFPGVSAAGNTYQLDKEREIIEAAKNKVALPQPTAGEQAATAYAGLAKYAKVLKNVKNPEKAYAEYTAKANRQILRNKPELNGNLDIDIKLQGKEPENNAEINVAKQPEVKKAPKTAAINPVKKGDKYSAWFMAIDLACTRSTKDINNLSNDKSKENLARYLLNREAYAELIKIGDKESTPELEKKVDKIYQDTRDDDILEEVQKSAVFKKIVTDYPEGPYDKETLNKFFALYMDAKKPAVAEKEVEPARVMK